MLSSKIKPLWPFRWKQCRTRGHFHSCQQFWTESRCCRSTDYCINSQKTKALLMHNKQGTKLTAVTLLVKFSASHLVAAGESHQPQSINYWTQWKTWKKYAFLGNTVCSLVMFNAWLNDTTIVFFPSSISLIFNSSGQILLGKYRHSSSGNNLKSFFFFF